MLLRLTLTLAALLLALPGCAPKVKIFGSSATDPLNEITLQGKGPGKLALIHLNGFLASQAKPGLLRTAPSPVQELVSALNIAEEDDDVRGVVIAIDSPGGSVTASDIIYHELMGFKQRSGKTITAIMFDVAASGGYYVALPANWIVAHPTTVTGSVGVIFMRPKLHGLLDKIGVNVEISKSGKDKDMGSPFRTTTPEEAALFQGIIDDYADRFHALVAHHRHLTATQMDEVKTARIFTATQAKELGLVDQIGYIQDGFSKAKALSGLPANAEIVVYRRDDYPNDTPYNTMAATDTQKFNLLGVDTNRFIPLKAGFHYLWPQGLTE